MSSHRKISSNRALALLLLLTVAVLLAALPGALAQGASSSAARPSASASASASPSASASASASASPSASASQSVQPSRSQSSSAAPTPTTTDDPCQSGRCVPPGKSQECIVINKVWMYRNFNKQAYLPVDLSPYFKARFDNFDASVFPKQMRNATDITELWGNQPWSYFGKFWEQFNLRQAGCAAPTQKFYLVWGLVDMYDFFQTAGDTCAQGPPLEVCAATMDARADSFAADLNNKTLCAGPPEFVAAGQKYVQQLRTHKFRSTSGTCVDGMVVEEDAGKCGNWLQFAACVNRGTCANLDKSFANDCPKIIDQFKAAYNPAQTTSDGSVGGESSKSNTAVIVPAVIGGVVVLALIAGVTFLKRTSRKSGA